MKTPFLVSPQYLLALTKLEPFIDSVKNLEKQRVWIYYSSKDTVVNPLVSQKLSEELCSLLSTSGNTSSSQE
jgi:hypothetical protein